MWRTADAPDKENLSSSYWDCVNTRPNFHRTFCGCAVQAMCQWTGVNVNNYFGPTIYTALGYDGHTTLIINGLSGTWGLIVTFIFIAFIGELARLPPSLSWTHADSSPVDRIGRRWPLIIGAVFCAVFMGMEAGTNAPFADPNYKNTSTGIAGVAAVFLFSWAFSFSFGPGECPHCEPPELVWTGPSEESALTRSELDLPV